MKRFLTIALSLSTLLVSAQDVPGVVSYASSPNWCEGAISYPLNSEKVLKLFGKSMYFCIFDDYSSISNMKHLLILFLAGSSIMALFSCHKEPVTPRIAVDMVGIWKSPYYTINTGGLQKIGDAEIRFYADGKYLIQQESPLTQHKFTKGNWAINSANDKVVFLGVSESTDPAVKSFEDKLISSKEIWWDIKYYSSDSIQIEENIRFLKTFKSTGLADSSWIQIDTNYLKSYPRSFRRSL